MMTVSNLQRLQDREGFWVRVYDPETKRRTWKRMGESRQEAHHNRRRYMIDLAKGQNRESVTVAEAVASFKRARCGRVSAKTKVDYDRRCKAWKQLWGPRRVDAVTTHDVQRHFRRCEDLEWSGRMLNFERTLMRAFFSYCRDQGWVLPGNEPVRMIRRYREATKKPTVILSADQVSALLSASSGSYQSAAAGHRNEGGIAGGKTTEDEREWKQTFKAPTWLFAVVLTALRTLLRLGDILDLRWKHVDLQARVIRLSADQTKNAAELEIPVGADLIEVLGPPGDPEDRVFAEAPQDSRAVGRVFNNVVKRAGIPRCTFHDLRKTGATQMLRAGVPLQVVQAIGGWKRPDVLLRHYTQANLEDKRKATAVMERVAAAPAFDR